MANNIYALLVGIDEYDPTSTQQISSLKGCVNDIKAVEAYLRDRVTEDGKWKLVEPTNQSWILTNEQATRKAVINGFLEHLCNADSEDVVLFYYAGHGAQEKAPEEFWHLEADRLDESLVCYDSRTENSRDLADKEIAYLISKVAENNPHVVIILDCCHSGSGTRDLSPEIKVRRSPIDSRERPLSSFIFAEDTTALNELLNSSRSLDAKTTGVTLPKGKHVMFSACRDYELAKEYKGEDGQPRGAFSYFLLQTLQRTNSSITYRDLARNLNALVSGKVKEQSPQVEATDPKDLDQPFLGGAIKERPNYFTLTRSQNDNSWVIDAGAISGIPKPSKDGDTLLAIFPAASTPEQLTQLDQALGSAQVMEVLPQKSKVKIISGSDRLSQTETYWAIVTNIPLPPLKIYIRSEDSEKAGLELVKQALQTSAPNSKPSLYVSLVEDPKKADYDLVIRGGQYWITQPYDQRPLIAPIPENSTQAGYTSENAREVILRLEHIARWTNILELSTPATSSVKTDDVEMEISVLSGQQETSLSGDDKIASEMRLEYTYENDEWVNPIIQIKLTNNSNKPLYCNVLDLAESYSISSNLLDEYQASSFKLPPKDSGKNNQIESGNLKLLIRQEYLDLGITEYKDIFKLIVSTTEFDASLLQQDGLNPPPPTRSVGGGGTLDRLMAGVNSREAVRAEGSYDNWMTKEVSITIVCPQEAIAIQSDSSIALQNRVVEVQPHPSLQAKVNLTTVPQASRDLGNLILPAILRQQPRITESFQFTTSRSSDPGLSALELTDVVDHTVVTPDAPLKLLVDTQLAENEHLFPFAYDGQFFLPLGRGSRFSDDKTEITLERLPKPTVSSRSIHGSIRIFFEKIVSQKVGSPFEYPILAIAEVGEKDKVTYEKDKEIIKARVAQSKKILLYIHGIVGDTASMVPSVNKAFAEVDGKLLSIKERYDVVLAFDYENIQTTIEENAKLLGERLQEIGLGANHGKQLHIVAHSMGGLVSRWFIERLGGNQVVQHLVMLGTPNAGSPWPAIQDWVFSALGIGLNQLSDIVWPTKVVADLLKVLENNDKSLEQMQPDSPILKELAENPDPGVCYTIIAGDRSVMAAANAKLQADKQINPLKQLMERMFDPSVNKVVDMAFFSQPNDIAVTLTSIKSVNSKRSPQPRILSPDAACDHLTYFTHPAGLTALSRALYEFSHPENQPPTASATNADKTLNVTHSLIIEPEENTTPKPADTSLETTTKIQNPLLISSAIITVIALTIAGVAISILWNRSPQPQPTSQTQSSQTVAVNQHSL
ncbi:MAG: caspase family protein [Spirirestis rafaelensis WJT71-NPBG6]|jgi:pimeloyl-ACP methyl ester carboxylesterase|nr:caspase family protein [Spirirestis rafaelensis WJT71-NPBG6]